MLERENSLKDKVQWKTQETSISDLIANLSEEEREIVQHLANARSELDQIQPSKLLEFDTRHCESCGVTGFHPKLHWQADQALEGAWTRINKVLALFGAKHVRPEDFGGAQ